jgi:hypothetical protein
VRCFHNQPAQARVIGRVLLQHPVAHAAIDRLVHDLRTEAPRHATHEVLAEAPVAQDLGDVGVAAGDEEPSGERCIGSIVRRRWKWE